MDAVLVWVLIVASILLAVGAIVALAYTLLGLRRQMRGDTHEH